MKGMRQRKATIECDEDGWWAYYGPGWKSGTDPVGNCHIDHAETKTEITALVRSAMKCSCEQCQKDLSNK